MKKIISLLLIICTLGSLLMGCIQEEILNDELKKEIIDDYLSWSGLKGDLTISEVECTFLGKYGDSVAVYFQSAGAYDVATEETVAGCKFTYPDSRVIRIWNDGRFYKISEAYDQRIIKKRHIKSLSTESSSIVYGEPLFIWEEKVYCDYENYRYLNIPEYTIDPYRLEVIVDTNLSHPDKIFDALFFENIDVSEIDDCTESSIRWYKGEAYRQHFVLTLSEPSVENMKKTVSILESKEGIREAKPWHRLIAGSASTYQSNENYDASELTWGWKTLRCLRFGILQPEVHFYESVCWILK